MTTGDVPLLRDQIVRLIEDAVAAAQQAGALPPAAMPEVTVERPPRPGMGDFASSFPLRAKRAVGPTGPNPLGIAEAIAAQVGKQLPPYLASVDVAPPGFVNFTLAEPWLREQVHAVLAADGAFGRIDLGGGKRVQVELVSANPTGPLHVGSGRNAALGDSLARVLARAGWDVQREYYYNDAGAQITHLHHSVWVRYQQLLGRDVALAETDYQGEYVRDLAQAIEQEHGDRFLDLPEERAEEVGQLAVQRLMQSIEHELGRLRITMDRYFSEASLVKAGKFEEIVQLLRDRGLVYEREGALWLKTSELGDERDRVMIRSDGRPTYTGTDVAYHYDKFITRQFDRVIDVWGADHHGQVPTMKGIVRALGVEPEQFDILLYQLVEVLRNGQPVRMGKRAGNFVTVGEVLDDVGADAMRWFLVYRSSDAKMEFDLDLARKQSSENPVYYVQYAHARLAKVLRDGPPAASWRNGDVSRLTHPAELALIRRMLQLPEVVELAARQLAPHHVPHYAYELARAAQAWYEAGNDDPSLRVLVDDPATQAARLKLAAATRRVLAEALDLVGVSAPEAM